MRLEDNMVTIKFSTANEAFNVPGPEIARILHDVARRIENGATSNYEFKIRDVNGNTIGSFKYTEV